jgi:hypothetical protein
MALDGTLNVEFPGTDLKAAKAAATKLQKTIGGFCNTRMVKVGAAVAGASGKGPTATISYDPKVVIPLSLAMDSFCTKSAPKMVISATDGRTLLIDGTSENKYSPTKLQKLARPPGSTEKEVGDVEDEDEEEEDEEDEDEDEE